MREKQKHEFDKFGTFCPLFIRLLAWKDNLCFLFSSKIISKFGCARGLETEHLFYEALSQFQTWFMLSLFQTGCNPIIPIFFPVILLSQIPLSGPYLWLIIIFLIGPLHTKGVSTGRRGSLTAVGASSPPEEPLSPKSLGKFLVGQQWTCESFLYMYSQWDAYPC